MGVKKLILICGLLTALAGAAQKNDYRFSGLDILNGLSHNQVNCIYKDAKGFMWFGTMSGLNRYDGYDFKVFRHRQNDSLSLTDDYISQIYEAPGNKLFIQTRSTNSVYDPLTEKFINTAKYLQSLGLPAAGNITRILKRENHFLFLYPDSGLYKTGTAGKNTAAKIISNSSGINESAIMDVKTDSKNNLIIIHSNGLLEKLDAKTGAVIFRTNIIQKEIRKPSFFSMFVDAQDDVWLYAFGNTSGVLYCNMFTSQVKHLDKANGILNNDIVTSIIQDNKGFLWIGTDHGGINILDKKNLHTVTVLTNKEDDNASIAQNSITTLYKDNEGILWLGTYKKGISYYNENITHFPLYRHRSSNPYSLRYDDVNKFAEDAKGNIWIGTNGGGLIYFDRTTNRFTQFKHDAANANSVSNDVIVSLCIDHKQRLWIGSYFGGLDCYDGKTFTHYRHNDALPTSIADDRVWEIYEDKDNTLWVGTLGGGLDKFDREKNIFYHYTTSVPNTVGSNYISSFAEDIDGNLWIATAYGIDVLKKNDGSFLHYSLDQNKLSNFNVICLLKDYNNNIWAGTRDGLNVFNRQTKTFQSFRTEDGLPDNTILNILEDDTHHLWISTAIGISKITVQQDKQNISITCKNYDELDGLQGREFNENAALKTRGGELLFGGANGFNLFNPSDIRSNTMVPALAFTGLQVFNKSIGVGEKLDDHIILTQSISEIKEITLHYNENVFSIAFAALNFINTEKNRYSYKLEGFNKEWQTSDSKTRKATYTNLDPGEYIFHVKAANDDGIWNEQGIKLKIILLPPFWKTPLAYALYILLAAAILFFSRQMVIQRAKMRFLLEQERKEAQRLHELDMMKIKFFTNVSHEFRTPLSLILTPLDKIIKQEQEPDDKKQFQLIHRNARRLLNLVDQLLDFRKMEVRELRLNAIKGDIVKFVKEISYSFTDLAEKKNIQFFYNADCDHLYTSFDHEKIERILFNLLSNAFKFTPENGSVEVEVTVDKKDSEALLEIKIKDTGIGIPREKHEKIFERFFQSEIPGTMVNQGSGIGLAITKEFVKMHDGEISLESEVNKGSCFMVLLPFKEISHLPSENITGEVDDEDETSAATAIESNGAEFATAATHTLTNKKITVLLVEDNDDFRFYLKDNLKEFYNIIEAFNGKEAWQKTLSFHPQLIVSDISMPEMDGIELCKKIKADDRTKQIPVILLTAFAGEELQLKGLATGAADYMTKPFNFEIMLSKIGNIFAQQQLLKQSFAKQVVVKGTDVTASSADEKLIQQALQIVEKNISNPGFSVEKLSRELCMSRVAVYKRIFALTGKSPIEFIRSIRLHHAAQLLEKTQMTVAEVAYEVGFNNPKYFTKYFKAEFNVVPSSYVAEKEKIPKQEQLSEKG